MYQLATLLLQQQTPFVQLQPMEQAIGQLQVTPLQEPDCVILVPQAL